jgi:uncharacterized protein with NRDE domain
MCLIAFAWNAHPRYTLVLTANRDEQHERPTAAAGRWDDAPDVYGGRDLRQGGSWLALNRNRRLAAVTNVREPVRLEGLKSRGQLVRDFVVGDGCAVTEAELRRMDGSDYGPFNLLLWDGLELVLASNRPEPAWTTLSSGIHGISNGAVDEPWPKVRRLTARLRSWLEAQPATAAVRGPGGQRDGTRRGTPGYRRRHRSRAAPVAAVHPRQRLRHPRQHGAADRPRRSRQPG